MIKKTILITLSEWAVKNFGIEESLSEVGTEILKKCLWMPLKEKIARFFSSDKGVGDFVEKISVQNCVNERKPERDVEDIYEEMENRSPDKELFETIVNFFRDNQKLIEEVNCMGVERKTNSISIANVENFFQAEKIETINIHSNIGQAT